MTPRRTNLPVLTAALFLLGRLLAAGDPAAELGQLAVSQNADGHLQIFKVDKNGELRRRVQRGPDGDWTSWSSLGGTIHPGIAAVRTHDDMLGVFAVDKNTQNLEWVHQESPNGSWSGWINLGGSVKAPVTVAQNPDGRIEVFAVNSSDSTAMHLWQTNAQGGWSTWTKLGGELEPGFVARINKPDGRLELMGVAAFTGALLHCQQTVPGSSDSWSEWQNLGGTLQPGFAAGQDADGTLEVFGINSTNGAVNQITRAVTGGGTNWSSWTNFGTVTAMAGITICQDEDGHWELFAVNRANSEVYHRWQVPPTKNWFPIWESLGGSAKPYLAVGRNKDGSVEIFAIDATNGVTLNHKRQISANSDWLDWFSIEHLDFSYRAHTWQTDQGLPHNVVQAIAQTPDGYLWAGTPAGLARFDGVRFVVFDSKNTTALADSHITSLCVDAQGSLWIGTPDGLVQLKDGVFIRHDASSGLAGNRINVISPGRDGSLWIGTQTGLSRYKNGVIKNYTHTNGLLSDVVRAIYEDQGGNLWIGSVAGLNSLSAGHMESFTTAKGLPNNSIRGITQDRGGRLWFGSDDGMIWHHFGTAFYAYDRQYGLSDNVVSSVCEDREGNLWVGTYSGLNRFRDGRYFHELNDEGAPYDKVNAIFEDRDGNLWIASNEGLIKLTPKRFFSYDMRRGLSHNNTDSVLEDRNGNLWVGTWGGGLNEVTEESIALFCATNGLANDQVLALCEGRDGSLWIGAGFGGGLVRLQNGKFTHFPFRDELAGANARIIHEDRSGRLWIGTDKGLSCYAGGKFTNYGTNNLLAGNLVRAICEDGEGSLWFGTDGGLSCWKDGRFNNFTMKDGLSDNSVNALYEDQEHNLWIGTSTGGLNCLRQGRFKHYTTQQGLFSDEIFEIIEDDYGWLWMSCSKGIFRVQKKDLSAYDQGELTSISSVTYGTYDGMESTLCNGIAKPAAWKGQDGRLWFVTTKGLVVVNPDIKVNKTPPQIFIESLWVDKKIVVDSTSGWVARPPERALISPPGRGELEFKFTAIDYEKPEKVQFKYILKGSDPDWVEAGPQRTAHYNNLRPGSYSFYVKACNADGVWNQTGDSITIVLKPNFWQTWWFNIIAMVTIIGVISAAARYITKKRMQRRMEWLEREHAVEKERTRIAKDIHDDLGSRLTRMMLLGRRTQEDINNPEKLAVYAKRIVDSAVSTMRTMDEIVWAVDPKKDTLDGLIGYINQYASEFFEDTQIKCRLTMPAEVSLLVIPAEVRHELFLALKEALNNAVKHARTSEVRLSLTEARGVITLMVEDNGCGFDDDKISSAAKGNGLDNMRKRMEKLGGDYTLTTAPGQGTRLKFVITLDPACRVK